MYIQAAIVAMVHACVQRMFTKFATSWLYITVVMLYMEYIVLLCHVHCCYVSYMYMYVHVLNCSSWNIYIFECTLKATVIAICVCINACTWEIFTGEIFYYLIFWEIFVSPIKCKNIEEHRSWNYFTKTLKILFPATVCFCKIIHLLCSCI